MWNCSRRATTNDQRPTTNDSSATSEPWFVDRAAESGLTLRHVNGMSRQVPLRRGDRAGRGALRLRQRRRPRRLPGAGPGARRARRERLAGSRSAALFRNDLAVNADGTRTRAVHRRHRGQRDRRARLRHGRGHGRLRQRRLRGPVPDQPGTERALSQQLRRHVHRRLEGQRHGGSVVDGVGVVRGLRPRRLAGPLRRQLSELARRDQRAVPHAVGTARLLLPQHLSAAAKPALSQQPQRHVHRRQRGARASRTSSVRRSASRPPTSTATAGWTSTWPTTASPTCCG